MYFGAAKEIITPTAPMRLACTGDFDHPFRAIHDDVYVRSLVIEETGNRIAFMCFDLLFHDRTLNDALEAYAQDAYGVRPGGLIVSYTHAHTAPAVKGYYSEAHDAAYESFLLERGKQCLDRAMCSLIPGTLEWGSFDADYNISRRGVVNGRYAIAPNFSYEHDTQFTVLCLRDEEDRVRSVLMNYACHPVFYPDKRVLSGEFPARLCQFIDSANYGCVSLFCQSAGGDVRPRPTAQPSDDSGYAFRPMDFSAVDAFAARVSRDVSAYIARHGCERINQPLSLACRAFTIDLPLSPVPIEYFQEQAAYFSDKEPGPQKSNAEYIVSGGYDALADKLTLHCQLIRITADHSIAAMGGEPCFGVKKAVLSAFGDHKVMFVGYTDACAYLVDDTILQEGGYEPDSYLEYCLKGPLKSGVTALYTERFADELAALSEQSPK